jgi:hypothetical protein
MPDPISSVSHRDVYWNDPPSEAELHDHFDHQLSEQTYGFCRSPGSVIEGAICDDQTAVSNACRRSKPGSVDAYLCNDKNLEKVENKAWEIAKKAAWKAIELFVGAKVGA